MEILLDDRRQLVVGVRPDFDGVAPALIVGDETVEVLPLQHTHLFFRGGDDRVLLRRDLDIVDADGRAGLRGVAEADVLDAVEGLHRSLVAQTPEALGGNVLQGGLVQFLVVESELGGECVVEDDASRGRFQPVRPAQLIAAVNLHEFRLGAVAAPVGAARPDLRDGTDLDERAQVDLAKLVCQLDVLEAGEASARSFRVLLDDGHVVAAEHDVERRRRNGFAGARGKHVV